MKLGKTGEKGGFTIAEMMISGGIASIVLAATITASVALQKSFNAVDHYFATHMQQVRIIDYLNRDVKRGLSVTTSVDLQSVTITMPKYLIQAGDPEAIVNPELVGTPRTPTIVNTPSGPQVSYGPSTATVVYAVNGASITRTDEGVVTIITSSTDNLVPLSTDVELANTEYSKTTVTFLPIFTSDNQEAERTGTTVYSTSYLRNRRRA